MQVPKTRVSLLRVYFPRATPVLVNTTCYLVAHSVNVGMHYRNFGDIWDYVEHVNWCVSSSTSATLDHLAIFSDEDN